MVIGRAALALAASFVFFSCTAISGLGGLTFDGSAGGGASGGASGSGGGVSTSQGAGAGPSVGGGGGRGQGGFGGAAVGSSAASSASASIAVSSAASSSSTGGGTCSGADPGVCCPNAPCGTHCCHSNQMTSCRVATCAGNEVLCDDSRDCIAGQICCGNYDGTDFTEGIQCAATCPRPTQAGQPGSYEICSLTQPNCVTGGTCDVSPSLHGDAGFCF